MTGDLLKTINPQSTSLTAPLLKGQGMRRVAPRFFGFAQNDKVGKMRVAQNDNVGKFEMGIEWEYIKCYARFK
jgi:hypothetical protein